jgi:hypothetical protein
MSFRGRRSRNKVSVGEPAEGSLTKTPKVCSARKGTAATDTSVAFCEFRIFQTLKIFILINTNQGTRLNLPFCLQKHKRGKSKSNTG